MSQVFAIFEIHYSNMLINKSSQIFQTMKYS